MSTLQLAEKYAEELGSMPFFVHRKIKECDLPGNGAVLYSPQLKRAAVMFDTPDAFDRFSSFWEDNLSPTVKFASVDDLQSSDAKWFRIAGFPACRVPADSDQLARTLAPVLAFNQFCKTAYIGLDFNNLQFYGNATGGMTGYSGAAIPPINQNALNNLVNDPNTKGMTDFQRELASTVVAAASHMPGGKPGSNFVTVPQFTNLGAGLGVDNIPAALAGAGLGIITNYADRKLREIQQNGLLATAINTFTGTLLGGR